MSETTIAVELDNWQTLCQIEDISPNAGCCVRFNGEQVAIFHLQNPQRLFALSNYDPIGKANVLSRGIVGSLKDHWVVASPLYKQHFDLTTGQCLEDPRVKLKVYQVREVAGQVQLRT